MCRGRKVQDSLICKVRAGEIYDPARSPFPLSRTGPLLELYEPLSADDSYLTSPHSWFPLNQWGLSRRPGSTRDGISGLVHITACWAHQTFGDHLLNFAAEFVILCSEFAHRHDSHRYPILDLGRETPSKSWHMRRRWNVPPAKSDRSPIGVGLKLPPRASFDQRESLGSVSLTITTRSSQRTILGRIPNYCIDGYIKM